MIIQVRGTSGSGKTTVMRAVMEGLEGADWKAVHREGRRKPLFYTSYRYRTAILGHYEATCGGCDTVGSAAKVHALVHEVRESWGSCTVLAEGLLLSEDSKWSLQMDGLRVIFLTTPLETCVERILERRRQAGNEKPFNRSNTENRVAVIERSRRKLVAGGVYCRRASSDQAPRLVMDWVRQAARCRNQGENDGSGTVLDHDADGRE